MTGHLHVHDSFGLPYSMKRFYHPAEAAALGIGDLHLPIGWGDSHGPDTTPICRPATSLPRNGKASCRIARLTDLLAAETPLSQTPYCQREAAVIVVVKTAAPQRCDCRPIQAAVSARDTLPATGGCGRAF